MAEALLEALGILMHRLRVGSAALPAGEAVGAPRGRPC